MQYFLMNLRLITSAVSPTFPSEKHYISFIFNLTYFLHTEGCLTKLYLCTALVFLLPPADSSAPIGPGPLLTGGGY